MPCYFTFGVSKRGEASLTRNLTPSPLRERGIKGVKVLVIGLKSPKFEAEIEIFEN